MPDKSNKENNFGIHRLFLITLMLKLWHFVVRKFLIRKLSEIDIMTQKRSVSFKSIRVRKISIPVSSLVTKNTNLWYEK
jgi:hypothetical protein